MVQTIVRPPRAHQQLPLAGAQGVRVVTESTSKALKVHLLWSYAVVVLGVVVAAAGSMVTASVSQDLFAAQVVLMVGIGICCLGVLWAGVTKARTWWHHG